MDKVWHNKRTRQQSWAREDEEALFELAKRNASIEEAIARFPKRKEASIRNKLTRMGISFYQGVLRLSR